MTKKPLTYEDFYARLLILIGNEKPYAWANRYGIKDTFANLNRYKHVPRTHTLQTIARNVGCDYNWLVTGEGEPFPPKPDPEKAVAQEPPPQQPAKVVGQIVGGHTRINVEVLQMVQDTLDEFLDGNDLTLETGKRSALIALLYDYVIGIQGTETDAKRMLNTINMIR